MAEPCHCSRSTLLWGPLLQGEEVKLVHYLGGETLEEQFPVQQEAALVAGGGPGPT